MPKFFQSWTPKVAFGRYLWINPVVNLLCTFNTPHGRYKFKRLPFGIKSAPEVFQKHMKQLLEGLDEVDVIMDDILVWGEDILQHDERLIKLLHRLRAVGLKLNKDKWPYRDSLHWTSPE